MSSTPARPRALRPLVWLLAMVLLPLATVLVPSAAHAEEFVLTGEVVDALGAPVGGVTVTARAVGSAVTADSAVTDGDGAYALDLDAGSYLLSYVADGFTDATYDDGATVVVDDEGAAAVGGEPLVDNELDPVPLDSDPLPVSGRVVTGNDTPVDGITVRAYPSGSADLEDVVDTDLTASGGAWALQLPIGEYDLQLVDVTDDGTTWTSTWLGGATPVPFTVGQAGALTYDGSPVAELPDGVVTLAAGGPVDVTGDVADVNGDPVAGVVVTAVPGTATDTTGADGAYSLALAPGSYTLAFDAPAGFADTTLPDVVVQANGQVTVGGVEAVGGVVDTVELTSTAKHPLAGTVTTTQGAALGNIRVRVFPEGDTDPESLVAEDVTDAAGAYDVQLGLGTYVLELSDARATPLYVTRLYGDGPEGSTVTVAAGGKVLVDDEPIAGHQLAATPMTVATDTTPYPLRGEVVDPNGDGLQGITVTAVARSAGDVDAHDTTDEDGLFELAVTAGTYEIRYSGTGYPTTSLPASDGTGNAQVVVATGGGTTVDGQPFTSGDLDATLYGSATRTLDGTVTDEDGTKLTGISVVVTPDDEDVVVPGNVTTGAGGTFSLALRVGTYTIQLVDDTGKHEATYVGGAVPAEVVVPTVGPITVDGSPVTALGTLTMAKVVAGTLHDLRGVVYDEEYVELDGVKVEVLKAGTSGPALHTATTGADTAPPGPAHLGGAGVYRIPVPAGQYHLRFSKPGHATGYLLDEWEERPATVTVSGDGRITAPGLDFEGGNVPDVQLLLPAATPVKAPSLRGRLAVGETVEVDLGTWKDFDVTDVEPGDDWRDYVTVEWFLDGKPADDWSTGYYAQKLRIPASAGGRSLGFRVTIEDDEYLRAPIVWTSRGQLVAKAPSTVKAAFKKGTLRITVSVPGLKAPTGKVTVLEGKKKVGKARLKASSKGKATLVLTLKPGKHKLSVVYAGTAYVAAATTKVKLKL